MTRRPHLRTAAYGTDSTNTLSIAHTVGWLASFGGPAILGMGLFAVLGSAAGYLLVKLAWRLRIWFKRRRR